MANRYGKYQQTQVSDYVKSIVNNKIKKVFTVTAIENVSGSTYKVSASSSYYLVDQTFVIIAGTTNFNGVYRVTNIDKVNNTFEITESETPADETGLSANYTINVLFVSGTYESIYKEISRTAKDSRSMIFALIEPFSSSVNISGSERAYKSPTLTIDIMLSYSDSWTNDEHLTYAIKPAANLADLFANLVKAETYDEINHIKFGKWTFLSGHQAHLLGKVSGVEISNMNIQIDTIYNCN